MFYVAGVMTKPDSIYTKYWKLPTLKTNTAQKHKFYLNAYGL